MSQHAVESPTEAIERFRSLYLDLGSGTVEDHFDPIITLGAALSQRMIEADATNGDYWKACVATEFAPLLMDIIEDPNFFCHNQVSAFFLSLLSCWA